MVACCCPTKEILFVTLLLVPGRRAALLAATAGALVLSACAKDNEIDLTSGVGITQTRSLCPALAIPLHTGDVTLFDPATSRDASAVDVVAAITKLTPQCNEAGDKVFMAANFEVRAARRDAGSARTIDIPYFSTVVQGGSAVVAKRIGQVRVSFAEGETRGSGTGQAEADVDREAATLPDDIVARITRRRRAGDEDAAVDPLSIPEVRTALQRATFELLVGFQLTEAQLEHNVRR